MDIQFYPDKQTVEKAMALDEPLCILVSFDGERAIVANIDDVAEHYILLKKAGFSAMDIDNYFRIVVNKSGASWTFVCPSTYRNITDRARRISRFYEDGIDEITKALTLLHYDVPIDIPARYRRHFNELRDFGTTGVQ
jgi:hypothetical protein